MKTCNRCFVAKAIECFSVRVRARGLVRRNQCMACINADHAAAKAGRKQPTTGRVRQLYSDCKQRPMKCTYCLFVDKIAKPGLSVFGCTCGMPWVLTQCPFGARSHTHHKCLFFRVPAAFMKHAITPTLRSASLQPSKFATLGSSVRCAGVLRIPSALFGCLFLQLGLPQLVVAFVDRLARALRARLLAVQGLARLLRLISQRFVA